MDTISNMKIIEDMLYTARKEVRDNGAFFLLWGWLVFIAAIGQVIITWLKLDSYIFMITPHLGFQLGGITWLILMPLGGVLSIVISKKQQKTQKVHTWFDDVMKYLWIAFGVVLGISLIMMGYVNVNLYPIIIALYGLGLFITGGTLKFKPLIAGGILSWVLAFVAIFITGIYLTLFLAASVLFGYIIPGYMLQNQSKKDVQAA